MARFLRLGTLALKGSNLSTPANLTLSRGNSRLVNALSPLGSTQYATSAITNPSLPVNELSCGLKEDDLEREPVGNTANRRAFTYFVLGSARFAYMSLTRVAALKVISTMSASADVLALASLEVDLSSIGVGNAVTVKWRGKPVFIRHRAPEEIAEAKAVPLSELRDPQTDEERVQLPEWLVMLGVCTHLGCVPLGNAGDYGGWFCPCHGSHYDTSGRIRKGPAPLNLEVPPYKFTTDTSLLIG
eukprot:CAMPEP_0196653900 /NCGR_PEP_ID=MMETSP1086-20130531/3558_1 /TAXON_ID=77921 /ORGANISM="Cyanoptyche  gloeocystis , Strain SAG4.97" /LENGTH=243 /DNA_ID=CAMNT_0041985331 /DNA_START=45 /DNA_END=776 /DNA_ORIENTATION=+